VVALNGVKVSNMRHLVALVDGCSEDYLHFDLDYNQKVCKDAVSSLNLSLLLCFVWMLWLDMMAMMIMVLATW
jgi:hypothetical protein